VVVALLSHLLLDWTNNYGVRPFFPFNPRWYAGSFVFIFEPVIFGMLLVALVAPHLFGLIGGEVGAKKDRFRGRGWAVMALMGMVLLWGWRWAEQQKAMRLVGDEDPGGQEILRVSLSPYPVSPYKWHGVVESPGRYQLATVDTWRELVTSEPEDTIYLPQTTMSTLVAKRSWLGEAYLDWSQYPLVEEVAKGADDVDQSLKVVTFKDLRFMYDVPFLRGRGGRTPLEGSVTVKDGHTVVEMEIDGRAQR
jgi:inner membrane protein